MKILTLFILLLMSISVFGQRANPDAMAARNTKLEILLLEYKEQLNKANTTINRLNTENHTLKKEINILMGKKDKTRFDIDKLVQERNRLLSNKIRLQRTLKQRELTVKLLAETNDKLKKDNEVLQTNNIMLEEAAVIADTIQRYQGMTILQQEENIKELISNYAQKCSEVTGQYKSPLSRDVLNVVLDGSEKGPENNFIESLTVSACFQISAAQANERVIVYFTLFEKGNYRNKIVRKVRFAIPKTHVNSNISYYEGSHRLDTKGQLKLSDEVKYYYEITYLEDIIAKGTINPS